MTLQHAGSEGSWPSGRQNVFFQGRTGSGSLQKHVVVFDEGHLARGASQGYDARSFSRGRREGWDQGNPQLSGILLQRRSTSSISLATPRRQLSVTSYARFQQPEGAPEKTLKMLPENETDDNSRAGPRAAGSIPERHTYNRTVTRLRASAQGDGGRMLHRGGFVRGTTMAGDYHKRAKTTREAKLASRRQRRGRKHRIHGSPAVSSRLRRMLRLRTVSASKHCPGKIRYHRVYLVLGLLHHKSGADVVQNGFVCLRACDVTHETNALISEAATFIWDRDRVVSPELTLPAAYRSATGGAGGTAQSAAHAALGVEPWMSGGVSLGKDLHAPTAGALGGETGVTSAGTGQRIRGVTATSAAFSWLTPSHGYGMYTQKTTSSRPSSAMNIFTIGVRVAVKPSTPSEECKCTTYLRDYLASQLATYPFLRHYILITKYKRRRCFWPFCTRWRRPSPFSVIGKHLQQHAVTGGDDVHKDTRANVSPAPFVIKIVFMTLCKEGKAPLEHSRLKR